jgi:hypothetical protein
MNLPYSWPLLGGPLCVVSILNKYFSVSANGKAAAQISMLRDCVRPNIAATLYIDYGISASHNSSKNFIVDSRDIFHLPGFTG